MAALHAPNQTQPNSKAELPASAADRAAERRRFVSPVFIMGARLSDFPKLVCILGHYH